MNRWKRYINKREAPGFRLYSLQQQKFIRHGDYKDQRTIITFLPGVWAPWCRKLISELSLLESHLKDHGIKMLAVISQNQEELQEYCDSNRVTLDVLADPHGVVGKRYGVFDDEILEPLGISKPSVFLMDEDKNILASFLGKHLTDRPLAEEIIHIATTTPSFPKERGSIFRAVLAGIYNFLFNWSGNNK